MVGRWWLMAVPTFKPLTEVLLALAELPELEVLQISNQPQVQVRVHLREQRQLDDLSALRGVEYMFEYTFPVDGSGLPPPRTASLCVDVPYLLALIRTCKRTGVGVMQVYDFWC